MRSYNLHANVCHHGTLRHGGFHKENYHHVRSGNISPSRNTSSTCELDQTESVWHSSQMVCPLSESCTLNRLRRHTRSTTLHGFEALTYFPLASTEITLLARVFNASTLALEATRTLIFSDRVHPEFSAVGFWEAFECLAKREPEFQAFAEEKVTEILDEFSSSIHYACETLEQTRSRRFDEFWLTLPNISTIERTCWRILVKICQTLEIVIVSPTKNIRLV